MNRFTENINKLEELLRITRQACDKKSEGKANNSLGTAYYSVGKYQEAIQHLEKCLSIAIEIGDKEGEGAAYGNLGAVYQSLGKYEVAITYLEKRLSIAIEIGDKKGEGAAYGNLGAVYQSLEKYEEAIKYQQKHLSIAIETGDKRGEGFALHNLGYCYRESANYCEDGVDTADDSMNKSANYFKDALRCFEWLFDHLEGQDKFKISIFDTFIHTYQVLMQVLIDLKQGEEALLVAERGRARALGDLLDPKYSLSQGYVCRSNLMTYDEIEALLSNNKYSIHFFVLHNNYVTSWRLTHEKPLGFHQKQIRPLTATIFVENQKGYHEKSLAEMVDAAFDEMQVRAPVNCEDRSLDVLEENDGNFVNRDVTEEPLLIPVQGNKVLPECNGNQENIRPRNLWLENEEDGTDHLEVVYEILVNPVQQDLTQEEIVIIPDGILFKVPFAALRDPDTKLYLSDTKRVRLCPSLTTLRILQERPANYHNSTGALIVGNPAVEEAMVKGEKKRFQRLPGAEREALELSNLMGVTPLIGAQATKQEIKRRLQDGVGVVHIAAHGSTSGKILLAPCPSVRGVPEEQDCMLTMKEVQESGCRAQLVVLSCCHSGSGEIKAEGVVGLTRAFLAAGARAVVASLWAIDDEATKLFMLRFYSHLKRGESASASLQQAMKEMRKIPRYSEPRYWAAFFLVGDDVTIVHETIF